MSFLIQVKNIFQKHLLMFILVLVIVLFSIIVILSIPMVLNFCILHTFMLVALRLAHNIIHHPMEFLIVIMTAAQVAFILSLSMTSLNAVTIILVRIAAIVAVVVK